MIPESTIIVGVDFKDDTLEICREAVHYALKLKSSITLVHAIEHEIYYPYFPYDQDKIDESSTIEINNHLDKIESFIKLHHVKFEQPIVRKGRTYEVISTVADELNARAIVIGVGKHYLFEELIGSTTEKVARMAHQKVIIVNYSKHKGVNNILAAFDFSDGGLYSLKSAVRFANYFNAKLHVLHVHDTNERDEDIKSCVSDICQKEIKEESKLLQRETDIQCETIIRKGNIVIEVLDCIKEKNIDLLSIGSSGHSAITRFFLGSTVAKIIRTAPCSIVVSPKSL